MIERWARSVARNPGLWLLGCLLATLLALWPASRLRLDTDLVSLLPAGDEAALDYLAFAETFGGFEKVFVLIEADAADDDPRRRVLAVAEHLADELAASPEISSVRAGLESEDEAFFLRFVVRRAPLLIDRTTLEARLAELAAPGGVERRVATLRAELASPSAPIRGPLRRLDPLGFADSLPLDTTAGLPLDPMTSTFVSADGRSALLLAVPARSELDPEGGRALAAELERLFDEVPEAVDGGEGLRLSAIGGPLYAAQDEALMRRDLERTLGGSIVGCALLLLLAFRGAAIPTAALVPLGVALVWTAGVLGAGLGSLSAVALGFAAVLVGLGIDYGIHGGTRFRQARLEGLDAATALVSAFRHAGPGIAASALSTAIAFATLGAAHFRPLRELGIVVAVGMLAICLATATVGAVLLIVLDRIRGRVRRGLRDGEPNRRPGLLWTGLERLAASLVDFAQRRPRTVLAVAGATALMALGGATRLELSADLAALRPADHPAFATEAALVERFGVGLDTSTVVLRAADLATALSAAERVGAVLDEATGGAAQVTSPADWLVAAPGARLAALEAGPLDDIVARLDTALRDANLAPRAFADAFEALEALAEGRDPGAPSPADWPSGLAELVRQLPESPPSGEPEIAVALRIRLPDGLWPGGPPRATLEAIERAAASTGGEVSTAVASVPRIGSALDRLARRDFETLAWIALLLVAATVTVSFRGRLVESALALIPVGLGSLWAFGLWGAFGGGLDLLSLSVLPILLGIGIDDGLHALHATAPETASTAAGETEPLRVRLPRAVHAASLAISLTTLTTAVGFGSLGLSTIPGLRRGGLLIALGVIACWLATLLVLPALAACGRKGGR